MKLGGGKKKKKLISGSVCGLCQSKYAFDASVWVTWC